VLLCRDLAMLTTAMNFPTWRSPSPRVRTRDASLDGAANGSGHSQLSGNTIVAADHRLEVCRFAVPRRFRNDFTSGVTRTSTMSPVAMYVP
jgi:hypothetical protein